MSERLSAEEEQCLLMDLEKPRSLGGLAGALDTAAKEIRLAWRVRSALGWGEWPSESQLQRMEKAQEDMRREYEAENARDPQ